MAKVAKVTQTSAGPTKSLVIFKSKVTLTAWLACLGLALYLGRSVETLLGILIAHLIILLIEWLKARRGSQ